MGSYMVESLLNEQKTNAVLLRQTDGKLSRTVSNTLLMYAQQPSDGTLCNAQAAITEYKLRYLYRRQLFSGSD